MDPYGVFMRRLSRRAKNRRGTATVELAFTLPIQLTVLMGTIEVCQMMYVRQTATIVAYEGARLGARRTTTTADIVRSVNHCLPRAVAVDGTININPQLVENLRTGEQFQISVTVPWIRNTPIRFVTGSVSNISVTATMVKE